MPGRRSNPGPLHILRANILERKLPAPAPAARERFSTKILYSVLGAIATFAVGDVLVKRNYESFTAEYKAMEQEVAAAVDDFARLQADINALVQERRQASQRLNLHAASKEIQGYLAFYPEYNVAIASWNGSRDDIERRIRNYTRCGQETAETRIGEQVMAALLGRQSPPNRRHARNNVSLVTEDEIQSASGTSVFCPNRYLFHARAAGTVEDSRKLLSVFEEFQFMHGRFVSNLGRNIVRCAREAETLMRGRLATCNDAGSSADMQSCIRESIVHYSAAALCDPKVFGNLASMLEVRFFNIDYRWHMSLHLLGFYEARYVRDRCEAKRGFWADFRKWDCERIRNKMRI